MGQGHAPDVAAVAHGAAHVIVALVAPFPGMVQVEVVADLVEVGGGLLQGSGAGKECEVQGGGQLLPSASIRVLDMVMCTRHAYPPLPSKNPWY